jgi:hypothetical protein
VTRRSKESASEADESTATPGLSPHSCGGESVEGTASLLVRAPTGESDELPGPPSVLQRGRRPPLITTDINADTADSTFRSAHLKDRMSPKHRFPMHVKPPPGKCCFPRDETPGWPPGMHTTR